MRSLKDPYGEQINYAYDVAARLNSVAGSASFGGITTYANNPQYRAWGGLKHLEYGNGIKADLTFDNALRPATYHLQKTGNDPVMDKTYQYYTDGRLKFVEDEINGIFDRSQTYDHQGRVVTGKSSLEASGTTVTTNQDTQLPYRQSYAYNAFNNMTQRNNLHWGTDQLPYSGSFNLNYTYANNRVTNSNWVHDADGRVQMTSAPDEFSSMGYDARGLLRSLYSYHPTITWRHYDGNGLEVKRERQVYIDDPDPDPPDDGYWDEQDDEYFIRSTVLGGTVISETTPTGKKKQTFVYAAGSKIARQTEHVYNSTLYKNVHFSHTDASGMSSRLSYSNGNADSYGSFDDAPTEADPLGGNMGTETPYVEFPPEPPPPDPDFPAFSVTDADPIYVNGRRATITLDGMNVSFSVGMSLLGFSANVDCSQLGQVYVNPHAPWDSRRLMINQNCVDRMTLANLGIFPYTVPGTEHIPDRTEYMLASHPRTDIYTQTPLTDTQRRGLEDVLKKFTGDELCNKFITGMLGRLKSTGLAGYDTTDIGKLLNALLGNLNNNFLSVNYLEVKEKGLKDRAPHGTTAMGSNHIGKTTTIRLDSYIFGYSQGNVFGRPYTYSAFTAGLALVHEIIHAFGKNDMFDHRQMAIAAFASAKDVGLVPGKLPDENEIKPGQLDQANSTYFSDLLAEACKGAK